MSHSRRETLIRVARKYNALVVADDVYYFLSWGVAHPANPALRPQLRLVDVDRVVDDGPKYRFSNVVGNGSFSKFIGPGCQVGWAEATEDFIYGLSRESLFLIRNAGSKLKVFLTVVLHAPVVLFRN
ncbi:hypothetical protein PENNAL_c0051G10470 [Penicillium nalgiovense]|uniref:Aminotransferase class I/classII domain-containing protein n=1 Tax=Penicillium nalgiovense TaxID=60175 RepID=A0A1V6XWD3_PENNA|nr:hypothetical protein PENNAL_c0051G10470 [Penicillium nalgiovense]